MKRYAKPNTELPEEPPEEQAPDIPLSEISISKEMDNGLVILQREVKNLMMLSARGKLEPADARDFRDTLKLLFDLKDREKELLKGLTDDQLEKLLNALRQGEKSE